MLKSYLYITLHLLLLHACSGADATNKKATGTSKTKAHAAALQLDASAAKDLNLVGRIPVNEELVVEFYEPMPGVLLISEYGLAGHETLNAYLPEGVERASMLPSDLFEILAPDTEMPEALVEAQARLDPIASLETRAARPPSTDEHHGKGGDESFSEDGLVEKAHSGSCGAQWFQDEFCNRGAEFELCRLNFSTDRHFWCDDLYYWEGVVCADDGNVTFRVTSGMGHGGTWDVLQGHFRSYWKICGETFIDFCDEFNADGFTTNTSGDNYHYSMGCIFD